MLLFVVECFVCSPNHMLNIEKAAYIVRTHTGLSSLVVEMRFHDRTLKRVRGLDSVLDPYLGLT
jgi:hypothetical protein